MLSCVKQAFEQGNAEEKIDEMIGVLHKIMKWKKGSERGLF